MRQPASLPAAKPSLQPPRHWTCRCPAIFAPAATATCGPSRRAARRRRTVSPCSPSPPRPALAASATVARFRVSTEMGERGCFCFSRGDPRDCSWWTGCWECRGRSKTGGLETELPSKGQTGAQTGVTEAGVISGSRRRGSERAPTRLPILAQSSHLLVGGAP